MFLLIHHRSRLHAVHAAAAFNIWQVATPSRSREGCAFDRASLPRATFTSYFSLLSIVKKNIIVLTRTRRRWSALVLPCTEVATFGADNAAHNQSLAPASAIEAASASPVLPLLPCTTAVASIHGIDEVASTLEELGGGVRLDIAGACVIYPC